MPFKRILKDLTDHTESIGAVMIDWDGEVVASYTVTEDLDMPLVGAHHGIVLNRIKEASGNHGGTAHVETTVILTAKTGIAISAIKEGYSLVVVMGEEALPGKILFESKKAVRLIEKEMG